MSTTQVYSDVGTRTKLATESLELEKWTAKRRDFLRMLGYGASAATLGPLMAACGGANGQTAAEALRAQLITDTAFWKNVDNMFVLNPAKYFMNIGTAGSMPQLTLDTFTADNLAKAKDSLNGYSSFADLRRKLAPGFGVDYDELAISANTSSGMCHAILGIDWKPGDVVVTTNHEHGGGLTPLNIAVARYGIEISMIPMPTGDNQTAETYVELFDTRVQQLKNQGKNVRAIMWSTPTYKTGTLLPIAQIMSVVKKHGLISIVDGAHLPGMFQIDYGALGMDFMSGAGHKWQCGPGSTGFLVIRNKIRASNPLPLPKWFPVHTSSYNADALANRSAAFYDTAACVTTCGSVHTPLFNALVKSCEVWDEIGRKKIETYVTTLSDYLKEKIVERWGIESLYSPKTDKRLTCALTCFNPFYKTTPAYIMDSAKSANFVARMASDYNPSFIIRNVNFQVIGAPSDHYGVRISTHLWTNADEIDALVDAMWDLANKMA